MAKSSSPDILQTHALGHKPKTGISKLFRTLSFRRKSTSDSGFGRLNKRERKKLKSTQSDSCLLETDETKPFSGSRHTIDTQEDEEEKLKPKLSRFLRTLSFRRKSAPDLLQKKAAKRGSNKTLKVSRSSSFLLDDYNGHHRQRTRSTGKQNENLYRETLQCILQPLGAPDDEHGVRPGNLADHLREIFGIEKLDHDFIIREELSSKPRELQLRVNVVEANNLKSGDGYPYCLLSLVKPSKSFKSPRHSPVSSPRSSPKFRKANSGKYLEPEDVLQTQTSKDPRNPRWNEEYQFDIEDLTTDELRICIFSQEDTDTESKYTKAAGSEKSQGLFSFMKHFKHSFDQDRFGSGYLGAVIIPVRSINTSGSNSWYRLSTGTKFKKEGTCHLKLSIHYKQNTTEDGEIITTEDYYKLASLVFQYAAKQSLASTDMFHGVLSAQQSKILDIFTVSHQISKLSQAVIHVIILLEMVLDGELPLCEEALDNGLEELKKTWAVMQTGEVQRRQKMPLTDTEFVLFRKAASKYISIINEKIKDLPPLFPFSSETFSLVKQVLGTCVHLLDLDLYDKDSSSQKSISEVLCTKIQEDATNYIQKLIHSMSIHDFVKDPVIPEFHRLNEIMNILIAQSAANSTVKHFYKSLHVSYYRLISMVLDRMISQKAKEMTSDMDDYQKRYHNYGVNITASSKLSLELYFALRKMKKLVEENVKQRDVFWLKISHYQDWFKHAVIYWLQTFKSECNTRVEKALEIDKDVVLVTDLVKFSHSSVDVKSCFEKISEEWRMIEFQDPDSQQIGVTKVTDMICDGARLYVDKIHFLLEKNSFYDNEDEAFDITDRLCITLNNIENIRNHLKKLPHLLHWEQVASIIAAKNESEEMGRQMLITLNRLITTADTDIMRKSSVLLCEITERMKGDVARYMANFTIKHPDKESSGDAIIDYISSNLKTLQTRLECTIYPAMTKQLWYLVLKIFDEQLVVGQTPKYYSRMKKHLLSLSQFFSQDTLCSNELYNERLLTLDKRLNMNSESTEELMLHHLHGLANTIETPTMEYYGHIAIKVAFMEETSGNVTIFVKVIRAKDLPGLDASGLSDPYVELRLHPFTVFGKVPAQKTRIINQNLHPVYNTIFQFPNVPKEYMALKGAALHLAVFDYDKIGSDDFAGEVFIHLSTIPQMTIYETVDAKLVSQLPLQRPKLQLDGPFQILKERSSWDKTAKLYVTDRLKYIENQREVTNKPGAGKMHNFFNFLASRKS